MRLAAYGCLFSALVCFWLTVAFIVNYFITFNAGSGNVALISFAGCIAFIFAAVGISRYEDAR